jgi:hypothetical protein
LIDELTESLIVKDATGQALLWLPVAMIPIKVYAA